jgi:hypothetical protein
LWRRATTETDAPGSSVSGAIPRFTPADRRRRPALGHIYDHVHHALVDTIQARSVPKPIIALAAHTYEAAITGRLRTSYVQVKLTDAIRGHGGVQRRPPGSPERTAERWQPRRADRRDSVLLIRPRQHSVEPCSAGDVRRRIRVPVRVEIQLGEPARAAYPVLGDRVKFAADRVNGQITIIQMEKAK